MSATDFQSSDSENELLIMSPEVPRSFTTPSTSEGINPRQLFNKKRSGPSLSDISNSNPKRHDTQLLILEEVKKTNFSLSRLDAVESRLKNVEHQQIATASSSTDSAAEIVKRKVPARVRVSILAMSLYQRVR